MLTPRLEDIKHKNQLFRLLKAILENNILANNLYFKGGTYAVLRGVLDRFSVDLYFDLIKKEKKDIIRRECHKVFKKLDLEVKDESKNYLQFFLKYKSKPNKKNTLKLEINDKVNPANTYEKVQLLELNMFCNGQTLETMFANKLIVAMARFKKNGKIAGRDFYDIHYFFLEGVEINEKVIEEKTKLSVEEYLKSLRIFIEKNLTKTTLNQDLNPLLESKKLNFVLKNLKDELVRILGDCENAENI